MLFALGATTGFCPIWMKVRSRMKINGNNSLEHGIAVPLQPPVHAGETDAEAADPASGGGFDVSSARVLNRLAQVVESIPGIRTEKVELLRKQIEEDRYHIGSDKLARKVIDDVLSEALVNEEGDR